MKTINAWLLAIAAALMLATTAAPASAQTISSNATGQAMLINDTIDMAGQIITPPTAQPLLSYTLDLNRDSPTLSVTPVIYEWSPVGPTIVGAPVWTGAPVSVVSTTPVPHTFTPNVALDPTRQYLLAVRQTSAGEAGELLIGTANNVAGHVGWRHSSIWTQNSMMEANFSATFGTPAPAAVPTLSEWAMILFGVVLAGTGALYLNRRFRFA